VPLHEGLRKGFAPFKLSPLFSRANDHQIRVLSTVLKVVDQTLHQRGFWPHNHHVDVVFSQGPAYRVLVARVQLQVRRDVGRSRVAGRDKKLGEKRALGQFPSQGMFTAS